MVSLPVLLLRHYYTKLEHAGWLTYWRYRNCRRKMPTPRHKFASQSATQLECRLSARATPRPSGLSCPRWYRCGHSRRLRAGPLAVLGDDAYRVVNCQRNYGVMIMRTQCGIFLPQHRISRPKLRVLPPALGGLRFRVPPVPRQPGDSAARRQPGVAVPGASVNARRHPRMDRPCRARSSHSGEEARHIHDP